MSARPDSPHWSIVADLRPRLHLHVRAHPQTYRGQRWYVLRDESSGRNLRFNTPAYEIIGRFDGEHSVREVADQVSTVLGEDAPSQDDVVRILIQLHAAEALHGELPREAKAFFDRFRSSGGSRWGRLNPLVVRAPLVDPDRFLGHLLPWVRPAFSPAGAAVWALVVATAGLLALANRQALLEAVGRDIFSPTNFVLLLVLFPLIKILHELGHGVAVKMWGGEVHEMGITLLVLMPVPYVDASGAWAFRERRKRVIVGAAGIVVEAFLAALALLVWLAVEPGLIKDGALVVVLIGSVSTLLFNGNPLLRFDGYYVFQDLIEIPNLYARAARYYLYLTQRYLLGLAEARSPVTAAGEGRWFAVYGLASFFYRLAILVVIALFLAEKYLIVGVALATWAVTVQVLLPVYRGARFLALNPELRGRRLRATGTVAGAVGVLAGMLVFFPAPLTTRAEGIVWVPDQAQVYAGTDGFVDEALVPSGASVSAGTALVRMVAPSLETRIAVLEARRREIEVRIAAERRENRVQSQIAGDELAAVSAEVARLRERAAELVVRAPESGTFVLPDEARILGRYRRQGTLIGFVVSPDRLMVTSVVPQSDIGLLRERESQVEVRIADRPHRTLQAHVIRETPSASKTLPSRALGAAGGGAIGVETADEEGVTATEKVFRVDLGLAENPGLGGIGQRAYVRFHHGTEPLARQWLRSARQLLLRRLPW